MLCLKTVSICLYFVGLDDAFVIMPLSLIQVLHDRRLPSAWFRLSALV